LFLLKFFVFKLSVHTTKDKLTDKSPECRILERPHEKSLNWNPHLALYPFGSLAALLSALVL